MLRLVAAKIPLFYHSNKLFYSIMFNSVIIRNQKYTESYECIVSTYTCTSILTNYCEKPHNYHNYRIIMLDFEDLCLYLHT